MKIEMRSLNLFILLFAASSLLFHSPSDFEAFAATSDGSVDSTVEINDSTTNGPTLGNGYWFGRSVENIGDLDGDGVNDLAVGAILDPAGGTKRGTVNIMFMNSDGSVKSTVEIDDTTTNGPTLSDNDRFGYAIANIGDLDGNGVIDLAVGAAHDDTTTDGNDHSHGANSNIGAVHIIFLNSDGTLTKQSVVINDSTANGPVLGLTHYFGRSVENIGDLDGDGVNDLAVGAIDGKGAVYIMFMNTDGSVDSTVEINDSTTNGPDLASGDQFGLGIANIGDLDGNGVNDLAVGAIYDDGTGTDRGALHIIFLDSDGTLTKQSAEINDSTTNGPDLEDSDFFGSAVEKIGDLDGNGVNDLAVGAFDNNGEGTDRGALHIIFLDSDGTLTKQSAEINDSTTNGPTLSDVDRFGSSVADIGDLDGNGVNDLAVGAYLDDGVGSNRGALHIIFMHETTQPTVTITSSTGDSGDTVSDTTLSFTATFSESTSNFAIGDITVTGTANGGSPEASNFAGSGTTYTFDVVQGSSDGTVSVSIAAGVATDAAGNDSTASTNTYTSTIDTTASTGGTCTRHVILGNCGTIAINNDVYRIINTWTNVPTTEVLVGQPVTVTLSTPNSPTHTKIPFASVHIEVFSVPLNYKQSAHVDYSIMNNQVTYVSQSQLFQVAGATHRIVQDPDAKNLEMFEVVFTMIFAKPMETSHVVVETKNKHGIPETLYLMSALKVNENLQQALTLEEKSKFSIVDPESVMKPLGFVDPEKDPSHYKYKEWFDRNFPTYTIYDAIGITFAEYQEIESQLVDPEPEMEMDPEPEMEIDPEPEQTKKEKSKRQRR